MRKVFIGACIAACGAFGFLVYQAGQPLHRSVPPELGPVGTWEWKDVPALPATAIYTEIVRFNVQDDPYNPSVYVRVVNPTPNDLTQFIANCANIRFGSHHKIGAGQTALLELGFEETKGPIEPFGNIGTDPFGPDDSVRCTFESARFIPRPELNS